MAVDHYRRQIMGPENRSDTRSLKWVRFVDRSKEVGCAGKERKGEPPDVKIRDTCVKQKKGFWRSPFTKDLSASDTSINMKTDPHPKRMALGESKIAESIKLVSDGSNSHRLELNEQTDAAPNVECQFGELNDIYCKRCSGKTRHCTHNSNVHAKDPILQIECMEKSKKMCGNAFAGNMVKGAVYEAKSECIDVPEHFKGSDHKSNLDVSSGTRSEVSSEGVGQQVKSNANKIRSCGMTRADCNVCITGTEKTYEAISRVVNVESASVADGLAFKMCKEEREESLMVSCGQMSNMKTSQLKREEIGHCSLGTCKFLDDRKCILDPSSKTLPSSRHPSASPCSIYGESFASCPSYSSYSSNQQELVSCSSLSISKLLEGMETHSLSSNSSYSHSEKLMDPESHRLSSNSTSSRHSSGFTEIFREGEYTHSFPSTPNSTRSSSCWNQEVCNSSDFSATESMLSERNDVCNQLQFSIGSNPSSGTHAAYTESRIKNLVSDLQSAHTEIQLNAAAELRLLAKHDDVNRILIARMGGSKPLIMLLYSRYQPLQLEATTALLNLSLNRALKEYLVKQGAIKALVEVLNHGLSKIVKENAAVALAHLAVCKANRSEIGAAGAIPPLIELLERGSLRGKKDAAAALYRMSSIDENKKRMIEAGALRLLVGFISSEEDKEGMVDKAMVILGNLVSIELGRAAFVKEGGITPLMQVIEVGAQKSKDLAIPVLFQMCTHSREHRSLMLQSEPLSTLISLSMTVDPRLKSQLAKIMEVLIVDG